ncbi:MAG: hypothetical protein PHW87_13675 [Methanothrix sp.]|nr:hypothetical protein [Methanothrix sp.]
MWEHLPSVCPHLLANPAKAINHSIAKYPSLPGVEGAWIDSRVSPRAESHQKQSQERT